MIEVENLCKVYGTTPALQDVSFSVKAGEILGFLGPNGAGKTTTLRILSGYLPATYGTARIAGYEVHEQSMAVRERIGYLPETPPLYPDMTVEGFLHFVARIKRVAAGDRKTRVEAAMRRCGILDRRKSLIRKLSKGYRQRVGIAQAIVHDPPVIVLDEPTVGLDPRQIIEVRNLIKSLAGDHTIILSTHILPEVSMTCSQVAIVNRGRIVATGTPDNLMEQLTSGGGYEIEVAGPVAEDAVRSLSEVPGVRSVELLSESAEEPRQRIQVICESQQEPGPELIAACVAQGFKIYEMRRTRASLEDVFLTLTAQQEATLAASPPEEESETAESVPVAEETPAEESEPDEEKETT
ncbi:ABC transporter ATP-binding protein [Lyngbya sp. CCY1209]|jgi:ABC-2 type transport system ATP-binding protein|uniref:ABC transporter ATP-binding protein n=1 Tax=Lyngbya sp. CCY1209 TaxID=2886103 RepID=UPI002D20DE05|nr:ABC transporter ATP-binding protein [Lyngbya sp. CCY1209]MEB3885382.1 ABC transporter ATP-binding protein [Lyngbya sp. CCY1209]